MGKNTVAQNRQLIVDAANRYSLDIGVALAQIQQESSFRDDVVSSKGAIGLAQFLPATAAAYGIDPYNPEQSADGYGRLMSDLLARFGGDYMRALIAYHSGPDAVEGVLRNPKGNPLTTAYYQGILAQANMGSGARAESDSGGDGEQPPDVDQSDDGSQIVSAALWIGGIWAVIEIAKRIFR